MPTFSIIIPAYNAEHTIERCIQSVLNQTNQDFEIIAINDGSNDLTMEILNEVSDKELRIKVLEQNNQGPLLARQNGINIASGKYVLFLDSDDYYESNLLETVWKYCKYEYDVVLFRMNNRYENNRCIESKTLFKHEQYFQVKIKRKFIVNY